MFTAVVRVTGAGRIEEFRERVRWLMVRDPQAEDYDERLADGVLEYRFAPRNGIPFPAFAEASRDFPELQVEAEWEHDGMRGRALIADGKLLEQNPALADDSLVDVTLAEDGRLELAMACARQGDDLIGYAASADRHTYFRFGPHGLALVDPQAPDEALEEIAFAFVEEWLWFDEEAAALERARYANYGYPVRGANLRSEKLALLNAREDRRYSSLDTRGAQAREALCTQWLKDR